MKFGRLNHIDIAMPSIAHYRDTLVASDISGLFDVSKQGVKVCFVGAMRGETNHGNI